MGHNGRFLRSSDDVRDQTVFQKADLIAQAQLALFHAGDLELIGLGDLPKRLDRAIQIAVLDPQGRMAGVIQPPLQPKAIAEDMLALTQASSK